MVGINEIWKPIKNYETKYLVSNLGRVKGLDRTKIGKSGKVYPVKGKVLSTGGKSKTYSQVILHNESERSYPLIHRLVAEAFIPNPENKPQVNHIDGDKRNNIYNNLEWATGSENQLHAYKTGLQSHQYGDDRYCSKLKEVEVKEIKKMIRNNERTTDIARKYGVNSVTITDIKMQRTWVRVQ